MDNFTFSSEARYNSEPGSLALFGTGVVALRLG